jgi:hypothetical protein
VKGSATVVLLYKADKENPNKVLCCRSFIHVNKSVILTFKSSYISNPVNIAGEFGIM